MVQIVVKPENVRFKDHHQAPKVFECMTGNELYDKIVEFYGIDQTKIPKDYEFQIWSAPLGYRNKYRLDQVEQFDSINDLLYGYIRLAKKPYEDSSSSNNSE